MNKNFLCIDSPIKSVILPHVLCPECHARIKVDVAEWDAISGEPTAAGLVVHCSGDDADHQYSQADWQPVIDKVREMIIDE